MPAAGVAHLDRVPGALPARGQRHPPARGRRVDGVADRLSRACRSCAGSTTARARRRRRPPPGGRRGTRRGSDARSPTSRTSAPRSTGSGASRGGRAYSRNCCTIRSMRWVSEVITESSSSSSARSGPPAGTLPRNSRLRRWARHATAFSGLRTSWATVEASSPIAASRSRRRSASSARACFSLSTP